MKPFTLGVPLLVAASLPACLVPADEPTRPTVRAALGRAVTFFHQNCSRHGGYVWRYSHDVKLSEGEAETDANMIWVQPPGTPAVGMALLDAYDATGDASFLSMAQEAAAALVAGQLQSGGWYYSIDFDPVRRQAKGYRDNPRFRPSSRKKNRTNITTLDDDTTPAAVRFLVRIDEELKQRDRPIHRAAMFALESLLIAQFPNGGWYQNWDRYPTRHSVADFPIVRASFPEKWSRVWLNDWPGRYFTNDNVTGSMVQTMLLAHEVYGDERFLRSARATGDFLIHAQLPSPQPAWAQQYNEQMQPVWDRPFEPPAVSGHESEEAIETLLLLYEKTGQSKYLQPIPPALAYLRKSTLPDGRLARFYELRTNRPLYFKRTGKRYDLTYEDNELPDHYGFKMPPRIAELADRYRSLSEAESDSRPVGRRPTADLRADVLRVVKALDSRGAWVDPGNMKGYGKASREGVIQSQTFIDNVRLLCRYLNQDR